MNEKNPLSPLLGSQSPWVQNQNSIWLGSTLTLLRNLEKFNFPGRLADDKRKQIVSLLSRDFMKSNLLQETKVIKAEEMEPVQKEFLVEHFLSMESFNQAHVGEAFVLDQSSEFLAVINLRDHLILKLIDSSEDLENAWNRLVKIESHLNKSVNFAFQSRFGFLTSDPGQSGTGLIVQIFLHLPALIYQNQLEDVIRKYKDDGIEQTGLQGDPHEIIGDIVAFHNSFTLGVTEDNILSSMRTLVTKVLVEEKSARSHLKNGDHSDIKDKVSRAYAILLHSYQIEAIEALHAISLLKLGIDLEWVTGTSHDILNALFFTTRRAHLLCEYGEKIKQEEVSHKRAEYIHQTLKGVTLHI